MNKDDILKVVKKYNGELGGMISILEEIQGKYGYLSEESLRLVAETTGSSLTDIYGVATFYRFFRLSPVGKHMVSVCLGTACHVRGAPGIAEEFERQLNISAGQTTPDKQFTLDRVNCLGACALGPMVVVDGRYYTNVNNAKVKQILKKAGEGADNASPADDRRNFSVKVRCSHCNHSLMDLGHLIDGHPSIKVTMTDGKNHGWLRLSSLYGSNNIECENAVSDEIVVNFFCPHCHSELVGAMNCLECGAPMVPMTVEDGGMVQVCSRRGCKGHILDFSGVNL